MVLLFIGGGRLVEKHQMFEKTTLFTGKVQRTGEFVNTPFSEVLFSIDDFTQKTGRGGPRFLCKKTG